MTKTKNRKESILKKAQSILNCAYLTTDIGDKSANRGSTSRDFRDRRQKNDWFYRRFEPNIADKRELADKKK